MGGVQSVSGSFLMCFLVKHNSNFRQLSAAAAGEKLKMTKAAQDDSSNYVCPSWLYV